MLNLGASGYLRPRQVQASVLRSRQCQASVLRSSKLVCFVQDNLKLVCLLASRAAKAQCRLRGRRVSIWSSYMARHGCRWSTLRLWPPWEGRRAPECGRSSLLCYVCTYRQTRMRVASAPSESSRGLRGAGMVCVGGLGAHVAKHGREQPTPRPRPPCVWACAALLCFAQLPLAPPFDPRQPPPSRSALPESFVRVVRPSRSPSTAPTRPQPARAATTASP